MNKDLRSGNHWTMEEYRQRITTKEWKAMLLDGQDTLIFHGRLRRLKAKSLGAGVIEIYKTPLKDE